ncbi:TonB-dependent siderophore receptor [Rhodobacteraceae bacterium]|nr:TonB-dependent siderophore receptor [Paracoccaceae bacterium]
MIHIAPCRVLSISALLATTAIIPPAGAQEVVELAPILVQSDAEAGSGPVTGYSATTSATALGQDLALSKTPVSVSVIGQEQIEDQGATSVSQALRYSAGVAVEYRGTSNMDDAVQLRGFGDRSFVPQFLDGLSFGRGVKSQLDPFYLERIEVVKGPNSLTYGQVTPGGLVAMVSKRPTDAQGNMVRLSAGSDDYLRLDGDFQGDLDRQGQFKYRVVGSAWQKNLQGDFDQNRLFVAPSVQWAMSDRTTVTLSALYQNEPDAGNRGFMPYYGVAAPTEDGVLLDDSFQSYAPDYDFAKRETWSLGYTLEHRFANGWKLDHTLRYSDVDLTHSQVGFWDPVNYGTADSDLYLYRFYETTSAQTLGTNIRLSGTAQTGALSHDIAVGMDYLRVKSDGAYARSATDAYVFSLVDMNFPTASDIAGLTLDASSNTTTSDLTQTGVFAQNRISLGDWAVLVGGRYDWTDTKATRDGTMTGRYKDEKFTGRAALSYQTAFGLMPYISYSTSFEPVTSLDDNGRASFKPTTGEQWEVGGKWASNDGRFTVSAAYFDISKTNITENDPVTDVTRQIGEVGSKGFELEARGEITDRLSLIASYFNTDATYKTGDNKGNTFYAVPTEQAAVWMKYAVIDGLDLSLGARYTGKSYADGANTQTVPSYTLYDAGIGVDLGRFWQAGDGARANLTVQNLTDERYVSSCVRSYCWLGEGRTVQASLTYEW